MSDELRKDFEEMSIKELEEMIHDGITAENPRFDDDAVLVMMEVLRDKKRRNNTLDTYDVNSMWNRFCENYMPEEETPKRRRGGFGIAFRAASVALVCGILLTGIVSTTAYARGFDLWGIVARWTEEQFGFAREDEPSDGNVYVGDVPYAVELPRTDGYDGEYAGIHDALAANGIDGPLAPAWLPEGYALSKMTVTESTVRLSVVAEYVDDEQNSISISVMRHTDNSGVFATHEKDDEEVEIYRAGEIDHYIMSNLDKTIITWINGSFECSIRGEFSADTARQIIDSVYER